MELRHLRYFLAVAEELSFTRAAVRLHVSQPTLSQQIRALEQAVGGPLFDRCPGGLQLTPAGCALREPAQRALASVADGIQSARDIARPGAGVLRLGLGYDGAGKLTHPILITFRQAFPQVELVFRELTVGDLYTRLLQDDIDVALTRLPLDPERHTWTVLFEEPRILGIGAQHPLSDAETVTLDDVLALPMPLFDPAHIPLEVIEYWLLNDYRNGYAPCQRGGPVWSPSEIARTLLYDSSIAAVSVEMMRSQPPLPPPSLHFLDLPGVSKNSMVAARRRNDRRPLTAAFCQIAGTVAHQLAALT